MKVKIRFFASLRDRFANVGNDVEVSDGCSVADVWSAATQGAERPANVLCAVNMEYVQWGHAVSDGDEVAFFPPVTGGSQ